MEESKVINMLSIVKDLTCIASDLN